jgi:cytochrome c553
LSCHDQQQIAPDVLGIEGGIGDGARSAGALNLLDDTTETAGSGSDIWVHTDGHTLGSTLTAPGGAFNDSNGFTCIHCHDEHGSVSFRNLQLNPVGTGDDIEISYTVGSDGTGTTTDVDVYTLATGSNANSYDADDVNFYEPSTTASELGAWCGDCHGLFHGQPLDDANIGGTLAGGAYLRHPTAGVNIGEVTGDGIHKSKHTDAGVGTSYNPGDLKMMDTLGIDWTTDSDADQTPSCFTCHKSHGNGNPFGLIYAPLVTTHDEDVTKGEEGTGTSAVDLCNACHP